MSPRGPGNRTALGRHGFESGARHRHLKDRGGFPYTEGLDGKPFPYVGKHTLSPRIPLIESGGLLHVIFDWPAGKIRSLFPDFKTVKEMFKGTNKTEEYIREIYNIIKDTLEIAKKYYF